MWWISTGTCFNGLYFFDKKVSGSGIESKIIPNKELAQELHKPIIRHFNKKKHTDLLLTIFVVQI